MESDERATGDKVKEYFNLLSLSKKKKKSNHIHTDEPETKLAPRPRRQSIKVTLSGSPQSLFFVVVVVGFSKTTNLLASGPSRGCF